VGDNARIPVLIVGGGPVGLALALDLGWRNVPCLLVEQGDGDVVDAKMFATGIRTVEFCRRWGIAEDVKHWGFPEDFPFDNVFVTSLSGHEIGRIPMPALKDIPPFPQSPEQFAHCPQFMFDPILARTVRRYPHVTLRYNCKLVSFEDTGDGVAAEVVDQITGVRQQIRADYLVGCDGIGSTVRKQLDIAMQGIELINHSFNVMFRAKELWSQHDKGKAGRYVIVGPEGAWASLTPADGKDLWRLMIHGEPETDPNSVDPAAELRRAIGGDIPFEIVKFGHWIRRRVVADHYGRGRVLLAGDAVHVVPPNGGLGMNTGIGDAVDLGWKLAATLRGFAKPGLLGSYERERRPVGQRNRLASERHTDVRVQIGALYDSERDPDALGRAIAALGNAENESWGIEFGYRYDGVEGDPVRYQPTTAPGARLPSTFLRDGSALYDRLGPWFTLLVFGGADPSPLIDAAPAPLDTVMIDDPVAPLYEARLVLVRPDTHVAWRGNACADGRAVWRQVLG